MSGLERLRRERDQFNAAQREEGKVDGEKWALNDADFETLQSINGAFAEGTEEVSVGEFLDELELDGEAVFGDGWSKLSDAYVDGFVAGAIEVFGQI